MPSKRWEKIGSLRRVDELEFTLSGILWGRSAGGITRWANGLELSASSEPTLRCFAVSDDGAVVGREDGALCFHGNDVRVEKTLPLSKAALTAVDRRGERIVVGTEEGDVILLQSDRVVATLRSAQTNRIDAIAIGPHGYFATGSLDHNVRIWSPDGAPVLTLPQTRAVRRLFWAAEGRQLLILADKGLGLRRWHLDELKKELSALGIEPGLP